MRKAIRGMATMIASSFRASPLLATGVFVLTGIGAALTPVSAWGVKLLTDAVVARDARQLMTAVVLLAAVRVAMQATGNYGIATLRMNMEDRTRLWIESRILELSSRIPTLEHFERPDYANEMALLRAAGPSAQPAGPLVYLFQIVIMGVASLGLMAALHPLLLLLPVFGVPAVVFGGIVARVTRRAQEATIERTRLAVAVFHISTSPTAGKEVRIFGLAPELRGRLDRLQRETLAVQAKAKIKSAALTAAGWSIFGAGYVGAVALVARDAVAGLATPGDVILVISLAATVNGIVSQAVTNVNWLGGTLKTIGRYLWLVDYAEEARRRLQRPEPTLPVPERIEQGINLEGVRFRYPGTERDVLSDVNLFLPAGATVAIVGDNGAGKTTLVKLLCRFYEPDAGTISVDRIELGRFDAGAWRERMSAAFQDFARFELAAMESVGVGDLSRVGDEPVVLSALDKASASDVLDSLPSGLATQLGRSFEDGVELSTGQWQKLALGRAMMRDDPLLLVLDEPTASLDAQTEHALFERYARGARRVAQRSGAITLLVSHRFSTVRMADLILVVDGGRVTETGTHDELVRAGGTYAELYALQARAYR